MDIIDEAINKGYIEAPVNHNHYKVIRSLYEHLFPKWLSETKVDLIGNKDNFESLINMDNFLCFLKEQSVEISNSLIKSQKEKAEELKVEINEKEVEIAFYIVGLKGHFNHLDTTVPVFHYIDTVLQKYNISYREAYRILNKYKGAYNQKYYDNVVAKVLIYLNDLSSFSLPKQTKKNTVTATLIRRFCELVNDSLLIPKKEDESATDFCEKVCKKYKLIYTDNVRQYFSTNNKPRSNDKNLQKVIETIIPTIPNSDREKITEYINKHTQMYG
jgi:hypothetical protein